jgi:hypothetical protein
VPASTSPKLRSERPEALRKQPRTTKAHERPPSIYRVTRRAIFQPSAAPSPTMTWLGPRVEPFAIVLAGAFSSLAGGLRHVRLAGGILRRMAPVNACSWASLRLSWASLPGIAEAPAGGKLAGSAWLGPRVEPFAIVLAGAFSSLAGGLRHVHLVGGIWDRLAPIPGACSWASLAGRGRRR